MLIFIGFLAIVLGFLSGNFCDWLGFLMVGVLALAMHCFMYGFM